MLIKSQVKYIQSLSHKKSRDADDVFIAEGPKLINELLQDPRVQLQELYALKDWRDAHSGEAAQKTIEIAASELERISFLQTPNQVLGIFKKPVFDELPALAGTLSLVLDTIQDPGNLGTIIRCADWFGIRQIICSPDCADAFNPKVVQSSMGSIARVQVQYQPLEIFLETNAGIRTYAAVLEGQDIRKMNPLERGFIVIGNESKGISEGVLARCTNKITIPRKGYAESLNAAVATGIILSQLTA